jgi:hypothetical protein
VGDGFARPTGLFETATWVVAVALRAASLGDAWGMGAAGLTFWGFVAGFDCPVCESFSFEMREFAARSVVAHPMTR